MVETWLALKYVTVPAPQTVEVDVTMEHEVRVHTEESCIVMKLDKLAVIVVVPDP